MAVVFDFSKESNDYRQRIAVVFKSLFESDFLENFDIILNELFNGHYSMEYLKEAIKKNKHILLLDKLDNPIIEKKKENEKFANEAIKMIILAMMLGEEYIKLKDIVNGVETRNNIRDSLGAINDIVGEMEKTRYVLRESLANTNFSMVQRKGINDALSDMDNIIFSYCFDIRKLVVDEVLSLSDVGSNERCLCESIVERVTVLLKIENRTKIL